MAQTKQRLLFFLALAVLLMFFAGCKGESPTAPPPVTPGTGPGPGTGSTTPPSGATIVLTASNPNPLTDSTTVITATVTLNNQPVANGTAVQFVTSLGTFTDSSDVSTIRTTTNGVTTATLTSPDAGPATVNATVNNVTRSITVTFVAPTQPPTQQPTNPTITSVAPNFGSPAGGDLVTITGTNFRPPVRVLFDIGGGQAPKEAFVQSVTPTQILVRTPPINLVSGQTQAATIILLNEAGTPAEQRVTRAGAFTYQQANLTPGIRAISPTSGPIEGGTRVTIIGDAFEQPLQVFFGAAQAQVISINFNQIIVISPAARDTAPAGSGTVTGAVDVKVLNVNSGKFVTSAAAFRYTPKMQTTAITPNQGPFDGGTRFTIDGIGFDDPVTVTVAGVAATVIKVTGTQIIAITNGVVPSGCSDITGPVVVTNVNNGDSTSNLTWIYRVPKPAIINVSGTPTPGGSVQITVMNAIDPSRFTIGNAGASIVGTPVFNATTGTYTYTVTVPTTLQLTTQACSGVTGASAPIATAFDVTYTSLVSGCSDTLVKGVTVNPPSVPTLTVIPTTLSFTARFTPFNAGPPVVNASIAAPTAQTFTIVNTGNAPLVISSVTPNGCSNFSISAVPPGTTLAGCETQTVSVSYTPPQPPQTATSVPPGTNQTCTVSVLSNAGTKTVALSGTTQ